MSELKIRAMTVFSTKGDRPAQEDHVLAHQDKRVFAVADGFGGPISGAEAARTACEEIRSFLIREAGDVEATLPFVLRSYFSLPGNVLFNSLIHANRQIMRFNRGKGVHERGGASVIAGYMDGDLLALASVGACDAWMFRRGDAAQLVIPRSLAKLRDPFALEPDHFAEQSIPLAALGMSEDLEPEIAEYRVQQGDWLLLHTDGLGGLLRSRIQSLQQGSLSPTQAVDELTKVLNESHFKDNTSLLLVIF